MAIHELPLVADQIWYFYTTGWYRGLVSAHQYRKRPEFTVLHSVHPHWALSPSNNPYVQRVYTVKESGTANEISSLVESMVDGFGNVLESRDYDFGAFATPYRKLTRTYNVYLTTYHVQDMPSSCQSFDGTTAFTTAFTATYDSRPLTFVNPAPRLWDSTVGTNRGNQTRLVTPYLTFDTTYTTFGGVAQASDSQGRSQTTTFDAARSYAVPSVITPNGNTNLNATMQWNGFLGLTSQTAANTYSAHFSYDSYARPTSNTTPNGQIWHHTYTNVPPTKYSWTSQTSTGAVRWSRVTYDGTKTESGFQTTTVSVVEKEYAPCACSPIGKLKRVSQPYKPGDPVYWTTFAYDAMGRTTRVQRKRRRRNTMRRDS
jgi:YD repeat-containing protein